ncbi:MAG: cytochrome c oxidase subunit I [Verrucomicrobia bacterium]|jgi:cytochrome c oxidase subunit 1|nr:cytochrome c oxidase subunit I [Verrucomicrobiota bacterium]
MSHTETEIQDPATTRTREPEVLRPERSQLGMMRPDHNKNVIIDWLTTVDHKKIGIMYGAVALFFLIVGGLEALIIRTQLAVPENDLISAQRYNQLFTMHGTTMIFLAVMPLNAAFFNFLVPLQIGARDVAFPRINSLSLWTFVAGAIVINFGWLLQALEMMGLFQASGPTAGMTDFVPAGGWFGYAPLTSTDFSGAGTDFWIMGLQILGIASLSASMNFIVTIINMRAPGMKMMRLPVFTWMTLVTSLLIIFAFPAITVALGQLMFDRVWGTNFFNVAGGGQPILWQHLFWIFGHPEVYILVLPAMGMISEVLPTFSKKPLFGYSIVVFSGAVIGFLGFAVWSHHMFTTGLGKVATAAFSLLTMAIAVPTGVKIFNWVGTLWGGRVRFSAPMIFALGFVWMFMMGGFSGIMHAAAPADAQQQDSYFVIAHFHYVIMGGIFLALVSGIYYWLPKIFGKMWVGNLSTWVAVLVVVGLNVTFFPMHFLGLLGMPRRTHTYLEGFGWESYNMVCTIGAYVLAVGILLLLIDMVRCIRSGQPAGNDPWNARTLEWSTTSPPQVFNFAKTPVIPARDALWEHKYGPENRRITYEDDHGHGVHMPSQSWMPLIASIGFIPLGLGMSMMQAGVPFMGYFAIFGLAVVCLGLALWALEGPGGYHLHPKEEAA